MFSNSIYRCMCNKVNLWVHKRYIIILFLLFTVANSDESIYKHYGCVWINVCKYYGYNHDDITFYHTRIGSVIINGIIYDIRNVNGKTSNSNTFKIKYVLNGKSSDNT